MLMCVPRARHGHSCMHEPHMALCLTCKISPRLQEAENDMKKVASITPKKERSQDCMPPPAGGRRKARSRGSPFKGTKRRLFHTPTKKKKKAKTRQPEEQASEPHPIRDSQDSESEDGDIFKDRFRLGKGVARGQVSPEQGATPQFDQDQSEPEEDEDPEEEEEEEDEEEKELKPKPDASKPSEVTEDDAPPSGFTHEQKLDMVDSNLLSLLTENCSKKLGL